MFAVPALSQRHLRRGRDAVQLPCGLSRRLHPVSEWYLRRGRDALQLSRRLHRSGMPRWLLQRRRNQYHLPVRLSAVVLVHEFSFLHLRRHLPRRQDLLPGRRHLRRERADELSARVLVHE